MVRSLLSGLSFRTQNEIDPFSNCERPIGRVATTGLASTLYRLFNPACVAVVHTPSKPGCRRHAGGTAALYTCLAPPPQVADCLKPYYVRSGAEIISHGAKGDYFYVIVKGAYSCNPY